MNISELARMVFRAQLEQVQLNLDRCIAGDDPVFLHDLRVAERRTRAALTEFKDLLPDPVYLRTREDFRWLHQVTNRVRDLDVGISHFPYYRRRVSLFQRKDLKPALSLLQSRCKAARTELIGILTSQRVAAILESWTAELESGVLDGEQSLPIPAAEYGCRRICKRYQDLVENGGSLTPRAPAGDFHKLRIKAKKLRYQIEIYSPILDHWMVSRLLRNLKRFQDVLGSYQDAVVQVEHIRQMEKELSGTGADASRRALEQLLTSYEQEIISGRKGVLRKVSWLISPRTQRKFQTCFGCSLKTLSADLA